MAGVSFVMMALGDYRFGLDTAAYEDLSRSQSWRWPAVDRVGARPALQYVGPGDDTVSLSGVIYPHFRGGLGQLVAIRAEADKGEPLALVDGMGRNWGRFVVTDLREGQKTFFSNGAARYQSFDLTLVAYGGAEDEAAPFAAVAVPSITTPGVANVVSAFNDASQGSSLKLRVAAKSIVSDAAVRAVMGVATSGRVRLADAIGTAAVVLGADAGEVAGLKRAATAVPSAVRSILSAPSVSTFRSFGYDIKVIVSAASKLEGGALDSVLDTINTAGAREVVNRLFADNDERAAMLALAEVRANG